MARDQKSGEQSHHHRSGRYYHQSNKANKKNKSKSRSGGRESVRSINGSSSIKLLLSKNASITRQKQQQIQRQSIVQFRRSGVKKIGLYVPLCPNIQCPEFMLTRQDQNGGDASDSNQSIDSCQFVVIERPDTSFSSDKTIDDQSDEYHRVSRDIACNQQEFLLKIVDGLTVCDFVVFALSAQDEVDELGMATLEALRSFGIPSLPTNSNVGGGGGSSSLQSKGVGLYIMSMLLNTDQIQKGKDVKAVLKSCQQFMVQEMGGQSKDHKMFIISSQQQQNAHCAGFDQLKRVLHTLIPTSTQWRELYPYLLVDKHSILPDNEIDALNNEEPQQSVVVIEGFSRGMPFNINRHVHLKYLGDYKCSKIEVLSRDGRSVEKVVLPSSTSGVLSHFDAQFDQQWNERMDDDDSDRSMVGRQSTYLSDIQEEEDEEVELGGRQQKSDEVIMTNGRSGNSGPAVDAEGKSYVKAWLSGEEDEQSEVESLMEYGPTSTQRGKNEEDDEYDQSALEELRMQRRQMKSAGDDQEIDLGTDGEDMGGNINDGGDYRAQLLKEYKEMKEYMKYPDEVAPLPPDVLVKDRYRKYRGLMNRLDDAEWDLDDGLPDGYDQLKRFSRNGRDFHSHMLQSIEQQIYREYDCAMNGGVQGEHDCEGEMNGGDEMDQEEDILASQLSTPGRRVRLYLENVPVDEFQQIMEKNFIKAVFGLLPYEHEQSVMNFSLQRQKSARIACDKPNGKKIDFDIDPTAELIEQLTRMPILKSKDELLMMVGPRVYQGRPVFSQMVPQDLQSLKTSRGGGRKTATYKSKQVKYVAAGQQVVASVIAPITIGSKCPVLYMKQSTTGGEDDQDSAPIIVGRGTSLRPHPDRLVIKRKTLVGYPTHIAPSRKSKKAVVKFMFHNRKDVQHYAHLPLRTQMGRHGNFIRSDNGLHLEDGNGDGDDEHCRSGAAVGYHGAFKAQFDAQLKSWDIVLLDLYKRVFPKYQVKQLSLEDIQSAVEDEMECEPLN
ncbi:hypothetical protein MP228_003330 [Amoeboaphelidium protococcarum]|nr:hypothetical protein MP228_003330 [Amoeboaphelidium protococcarum]